MKINGLQPQDVYKSYMNSNLHSDDSVEKDKKDETDVNADRVEISSESADLSEARELTRKSGIMSAHDSSRSEKVEALKQQVESGEYNVSSKDVAKSILTGNYLDSRA